MERRSLPVSSQSEESFRVDQTTTLGGNIMDLETWYSGERSVRQLGGIGPAMKELMQTREDRI